MSTATPATFHLPDDLKPGKGTKDDTQSTLDALKTAFASAVVGSVVVSVVLLVLIIIFAARQHSA